MTDLDRIKDFLSVLKDNTSLLKDVSTKELRKFALVVGDFDPKLEEAYDIEHPQELDSEDHINFYFYQAMKSRKTAAAKYITQRYEEAARDMTGTDMVDFMFLLNAIEKETLLIESFIETDNSANSQILTHFKTWIHRAINDTHVMNNLTNSQDTPSMSDRSENEARRTQAMFKVKMNALNKAIVLDKHFLETGFINNSSVFYKKFLPFDESAVADQETRIRLYREKVDSFLDNIKDRKTAREKILSLASVGKSVPRSGPRTMVQNADIDPEEILFWNNFEDTTSFAMRGSHSELKNTEKGDPHSQYLLRSGGKMSGDIETDARIDGVDVSEHRHTGQDGTKKISGKDIVKGTLKDDLVKTEDRPPKPINLTVPRMDMSIIPPGQTVIDTFMTYDSYDRYHHEMEIRHIETICPDIYSSPFQNLDPDDPTYLQDTSSFTYYTFDPQTTYVDSSFLYSSYQTVMRINADLTCEYVPHPSPRLWSREPSSVYPITRGDGKYGLLSANYRSYSFPPRDGDDWEHYAPFMWGEGDQVTGEAFSWYFTERRWSDSAFLAYSKDRGELRMERDLYGNYIPTGEFSIFRRGQQQNVYNEWALSPAESTGEYTWIDDYTCWSNGVFSVSISSFAGMAYTEDKGASYVFRHVPDFPTAGMAMKFGSSNIIFGAAAFGGNDGWFSNDDGQSWVQTQGSYQPTYVTQDPLGRIWGYASGGYLVRYNISTNNWDVIASSADFEYTTSTGGTANKTSIGLPTFDAATNRAFVSSADTSDPRIWYSNNWGDDPWIEIDPEQLHFQGRNYDNPSHPNGLSRIRSFNGLRAIGKIL